MLKTFFSALPPEHCNFKCLNNHLYWNNTLSGTPQIAANGLLPFEDRPLTFVVETTSKAGVALRRSSRKFSLSSSLISTVICKKDKLKQKLRWFCALSLLSCRSDGEKKTQIRTLTQQKCMEKSTHPKSFGRRQPWLEPLIVCYLQSLTGTIKWFN